MSISQDGPPPILRSPELVQIAVAMLDEIGESGVELNDLAEEFQAGLRTIQRHLEIVDTLKLFLTPEATNFIRFYRMPRRNLWSIIAAAGKAGEKGPLSLDSLWIGILNSWNVVAPYITAR